MQLCGRDAWQTRLASRSLSSRAARGRQISQAQAVLSATARVGRGGEASLSRIYLIQDILKNFKSGVSLFEILDIGAIFSVTFFIFYLRTGGNVVNSETCLH